MDPQTNGTGNKDALIGGGWAVVNLAAGMVSAQLDVPIPVALDRLHAYAADQGCLIVEVAADVVARRLRFDVDDR